MLFIASVEHGPPSGSIECVAFSNEPTTVNHGDSAFNFSGRGLRPRFCEEP